MSSSSGDPPKPSTPASASPPVSLPGVFVNTETKRLGVINGSHNTHSEEGNETCIVLPDYTLWLEVPPTSEGAEALWKSALDPAYPRTGVGRTGLKCYTIPFNCVILLCESSCPSLLLDGLLLDCSALQALTRGETIDVQLPPSNSKKVLLYSRISTTAL